MATMRLPSKSVTFWILMVASAASALLVPNWSRSLRALSQPLALLGWPVSRVTREADALVDRNTAKRITSAEAEGLRQESERLRSQVLNQRLYAQTLERRVDDLTGLLDQMPAAHLQVVVAPVVSYDASPERRSLQILLNERQWQVLRGRTEQWVVAAFREAPAWDPDATLADLLRRGWLIGRIIEIHPRVARVQLTSDPAFRAEVQTARVLEDGAVLVADERCILQGEGSAGMKISQAVRNYLDLGYRAVVAPRSPALPVPMTIGWVTESRPRSDSAQHFDLRVQPWADLDEVAEVFILITAPQSE